MKFLSDKTLVWLHGLCAAFISSFSTSAAGFLTMHSVFNFSHDGLINMVKLSAVPAAVTVFGYLKQSPLPPISPENGQSK
jgi:hypothetical protein